MIVRFAGGGTRTEVQSRIKRRIRRRTAGLRGGSAQGLRRRFQAHAAQDRAGQGAQQGSLCDALARAARTLTRLVSHCAADGVVFPGRDRLLPFNRAVHATAHLAEIKKRVTPHTLRHSFATTCWSRTPTFACQVLLGHAKLDTIALYAQVATNAIRAVTSLLNRLTPLRANRNEAAGITAGEHVPSCSGGRGHLPRLRLRGSNTGHVSLAQLKVMSAIENCRTAALGGHVASCENCSYTTIAL